MKERGGRIDRPFRRAQRGDWKSKGTRAVNDAQTTNSRDFLGLLVSGGVLLSACWAVRGASWAFAPEVQRDRPVVTVLLWLGLDFLAYLWGLRCATRLGSRHVPLVVLTVAVLSRAVLLDSVPIQEIDFYRYVWDGNVAVAGVSPYRFSPAEVRTATAVDGPTDLTNLRRGLRENRGLDTVLARVHFPELRTPYPPVSQVVFAAAAAVTPQNASVAFRTRVMRAFVLAFDLATVLVVLGLLRRLDMPAGWSVAYAWCPLVLKEFGNSLHLDSIAVFFATAAVYALVRTRDARQPLRWLLAAAGLLALGVGAKLYPVLLVPVVATFAYRRFGTRHTLAAAGVFAGVSAVVLLPMIHAKLAQPEQEGLTRFLLTWEMNDFLFLLLIENLKTPAMLGEQPEAWFSVLPDAWRAALTSGVPRVDGVHRVYPAFVVARLVTLAVWGAFVARSVRRVWLDPEARTLLDGLFTTLAWFWMLAPTQNPWYWCWAVPLLPFARRRTWILVSGFASLYYLRFWFAAHFADSTVAGSPYVGIVFFDLVVTWIEFAPLLVLLACERFHSDRSKRRAVPARPRGT